jgi:hypothetical protein
MTPRHVDRELGATVDFQCFMFDDSLIKIAGAEIMSRDKRTEFRFDPERLRERYCPSCGELRPVLTRRDANGMNRYFCAKCQALLGEEAADSFDKPDSGSPNA